MNRWTQVFFAALIMMLDCSRPQRSASETSSQIAQPLSLREIRPFLTYDLTMEEAERRFGPPGAEWVSGAFYSYWLLNDSNVLFAAFSLDTEHLREASVTNRKGKVIERLLDRPKN